MEQKWPQQIWIVRHGQSAGNVARDTAEAEKHLLINIAERDVDVPLSTLGEQQAQALADWFVSLPPEQQPTVVLYSPYVRAHETAQAVLSRLDKSTLVSVVADERLREKGWARRRKRSMAPTRPPSPAPMNTSISSAAAMSNCCR